MKTSTLIALLFCAATAAAQAPPDGAQQQEKMKPFAAWAGRWQGEGSMQMGPGEAKKTRVDETVQLKLDGTVMLVEGIGKATRTDTGEEMVVHHALAVLSYNAATKAYNFRTYLKDGRSADAWFNVAGDNKYQWGFDNPAGKMRYTIVIDPQQNTWRETGEFSRDGGSTWKQFFEMNLTKTEPR